MSHRNFILVAAAALSIFQLSASSAYAGVMELSASYSSHTSMIDQNNFTKDEYATGSFAWYFRRQSALEFSYTDGFGEQSLEAVGDIGPTIYYQNAQMLGLDLVYSLLSNKYMIQPFVRAGGLHIFKKMYEQFYNGQVSQYGSTVNAIVPSYGGGIDLHITKLFGIKASYDRWESGVDGQSGIWDEAYRVGVSWFFY